MKYLKNMNIERPDPPIVGRVTYSSIELTWSHVKEKLPTDQRFRYSIQECSETNKQEWGTVYSGFGISTIVESLEPSTEYTYRLCVFGPDNERSEFSPPVKIKTTKEPLNGEAFHKAIALDRKSDVEKMLESSSGSKFFEVPDKFGNLPLMIAIIKNNYEMIETLIQHGIDVNAQNESLKTAIMLAAFYGKLNIVKLLREHEASYEFRDNSGMSVVHYAVDGGDVSTLDWILYDGADVNAIDKDNGWSPLLRAASVNSSQDVAKTLIKHKAKIDLFDKNKKTALMIATINGNLPFVQVLVQNGANMYAKNQYGKTLYELAVSMDRRPIVKFFDEYIEKNNIKPIK